MWFLLALPPEDGRGAATDINTIHVLRSRLACSRQFAMPNYNIVSKCHDHNFLLPSRPSERVAGQAGGLV